MKLGQLFFKFTEIGFVVFLLIIPTKSLAQNFNEPAFLWALQENSSYYVTMNNVAIDRENNYWVSGHYSHQIQFDETKLTNDFAMFLAKFTSAGKLIWMRDIKHQYNTGFMVPSALIDTDADGNCYFTSYIGPGEMTVGAYSLNKMYITPYLIKYDPDGNIVWLKEIVSGPQNISTTKLVVDHSNNIWVTGQYESGYQTGQDRVYAKGGDFFISKFDSNGDCDWLKRIWGDGQERIYDMLVDVNDDVVLAGIFTDPFYLDQIRLRGYGSFDIFMAKIDLAGNFFWAKRIGGKEIDGNPHLATDQEGNYYLTGEFSKYTNFEVTSFRSNGFQDVFVAKLDNNGNFLWAKQAGSYSYDHAGSIAVDSKGRIFVCSNFNNAVIIVDSESQEYNVSGDALTIFSNSGETLWASDTGFNILQFDQYDYGVVAAVTGSQSSSLGNLAIDPYKAFLAKFTLEEMVTNLKIQTPEPDEVWFTGNSGSITWESEPFTGEVKIELSVDSGNTWETLALTENTGQFAVTPLPEHESGQCRLRISSVENTEVVDESAGNFSIIIPENIKTKSITQIPEEMDVPVLDGQFADSVWALAQPAELLSVGGQPGDFLMPWTNAADNQVTWKALWSKSENKLFFAINIQDDVAGEADHDPENFSRDDAFEIFISENSSIGFYETAEWVQHYLIRNDNQIHLAHLSGAYQGSAIETAIQKGENGNWQLEFAVGIYTSFPNTPRTLTEGDTIRCDLWYSDSDNNLEENGLFLGEHQTGWGYMGQAGRNAKTLQNLILGPVPETPPVEQQCLRIAEKTGLPGEDAIFDIQLEGNRSPIDAFGFDFIYSPEHLSFKSISQGELCTHFSFLEAKEVKPGIIKIGGFDTQPIPENSLGSLLQIEMTVIGNESSLDQAVILSNLSDDLRGYQVFNQDFSPEEICSLGDVNQDQQISPADALEAFRIYLNSGVPTIDDFQLCSIYAADVNCNNEITPGDAMIIMNAFLDGLNPPLQCQSVLAKAQSTEFQIAIDDAKGNRGEEIRIPVYLKVERGNFSYFGLDLRYDPEQIEEITILPGDLTAEWTVLENREITEGEIRVGGFHSTAAPEQTAGELIVVAVQLKSTAKGSTPIELLNFADFSGGSQISEKITCNLLINESQLVDGTVPTQFALSSNYPNPFNMQTQISYQIAAAGKVKISVFNSLGQNIRNLVASGHTPGNYIIHWDGCSENGQTVTSGIYFCRMEAPGFQAVQKMVVIK